jgi:hypothetical protein
MFGAASYESAVMKTATPLTTIRFGEMSSLLLITLSITALIAGIAMAAVAGSGGFNSTGSMNVARVNHAATLLPNGEVLVAGGDNGISGSLASTLSFKDGLIAA